MYFYSGDPNFHLALPPIEKGFEGRILLILGGDLLASKNIDLNIEEHTEDDLVQYLCSDFGIPYSKDLRFFSSHKKDDEGGDDDGPYHFEYYLIYSVKPGGPYFYGT